MYMSVSVSVSVSVAVAVAVSVSVSVSVSLSHDMHTSTCTSTHAYSYIVRPPMAVGARETGWSLAGSVCAGAPATTLGTARRCLRVLPPGGVRPACWRRLPATRPAAAAACARRVCPAAACGAPAPRRPRPSDPASRVLCSASAPEPRRLTPTCLAANWPLLERCPRRWKAQRPHAKRHGQAQHSPCRRPLPRAAASRLRPAASSRSAAARIATRG